MSKLTTKKQYQHLVQIISDTFTQGQQKTISAINSGLVITYWNIGQHIVEFEQQGSATAEYGKKLLTTLSKDLKLRHGKGFSLSNLKRFRQFYLADPNGATLSHHLSWSHHVELLKISNTTEREQYSENELESALCNHLEQFLLELGKGFTFVGRQYRITLNNRHYKIDLVFYHRILRCFVLVDLKINEVRHQDIGQMNMYLGYFAAEENIEDDNPPVGIILSRDKDELMVEYATYGMDSQLFVQKYQLYLPNEEQLRREIEATLAGQKGNDQ
ncbi:PDDEXK nuclease domain-containing protein [Endozoicomonas sp. Mp262]|uniref:PDDEXK nuclease domain-containing protein n=1 Tax=Endozoicomonas sp. Mp262 TaxID=2919499 RepID=UPI0021D87CAC